MDSYDITQPSTHLGRKPLVIRDEWLEDWLKDWGDDRARQIYGLAVPCKTSLKVAQEMKPEKVKTKAPRLMYADGQPLPVWLCTLIYDLQSMWKKGATRQTRVVTSRTPAYMPRPRISQLNRAIGELAPLHYGILVMRYELGWSWQLAERNIGLPKRTYHDRLKKAKKALIQQLTKKLDEDLT
jgi:hypothetical protein